eukprot:GHVS01027011.1.p1 GENE.GHVS01027011.1~~GHVS01027011.1.p1  ORF type:complete len:468 (+),score=83.27 GHVS01027011.1:24-1406(+)
MVLTSVMLLRGRRLARCLSTGNASPSFPPPPPLASHSTSALTSELLSLESDLLPFPSLLTHRDRLVKHVQSRVSRCLDSCVVSPFGSAANGLWTASSDVDLCLQLPVCSTRTSQVKVLRRVAAELHKDWDYLVEPRFSAAVPIIHWEPRKRKTTNWTKKEDKKKEEYEHEALRPDRQSPPEENSNSSAIDVSISSEEPLPLLACDLSVNNLLALVNSRLIGAYVNIDPRVRCLCLAVKKWAASRDINDRSRGTLSSFALVLMVIHYLQHAVVPPLLPSLQDLAVAHHHTPVYINGVDCRYSTDAAEIREELIALSGGGRLLTEEYRQDVGELLTGFFKYYGYMYKSGVIAIRSPLIGQEILRHQTGSTEQNFLFIDNPLEVGKDIANVLSSQYSRIRQELRRAYTILSQGRGLLQELCRPPDPQISGLFGVATGRRKEGGGAGGAGKEGSTLSDIVRGHR